MNPYDQPPMVFDRTQPIVDPIHCSDPRRSPLGGWLLSGTRAPDVERGAWASDWYERYDTSTTTYLYKDPVKTTMTKVADAREYRGMWTMFESQRAEVDALKAAHPEWEWARCFEAAGARWMAEGFECIMDEPEIVVELPTPL
ncbi:hypothetical protein B0A48_11003 [Cryoendolithus antarcticus]|uniref:Uncharacterized protein n=1 Tax=Cryoendolithus antarcticus TaxID=1507870 RepID=A0A1V8SZR6_9PEZI|nr:hypothetical protein B0A48_11003 [Cryoendolithus antarcticus]